MGKSRPREADTQDKTVTDSCSRWKTEKGAAWPWCGNCGVRADLHAGSPFKDAVARLVAR